VYQMINEPAVEVPIGDRAARWTTVAPHRTVLLVAHNVTTITRLLDVIPAFNDDVRVQLVFTRVDGDPFQHGLPAAVGDTGLVMISWIQATSTHFDLAIAASHHGKLAELGVPLVILSHGIGYTKYSPREPRAESREPRAESREPFGLSAETVLREGEPFAKALVLSHHDQQRQLSEDAPSAAPSAVVAGDPCYDRIIASLALRRRYRSALRIGDRTLILVSSTWSRTSLLGSRPELPRELMGELPRDSYAVAVALHPNTWHGHGPGQIRRWYADCLRSGMILLAEFDGWRAGLIAADVVIGDFGSVTGYAAAIGRPTLLAAFDEVPPNTPIAALGATAPQLPAVGPFRPVVDDAIMEHRPERFAAVTDVVTSMPGESLGVLRALFYRLLDLDEPPTEAAVEVVPTPRPDPVAPALFADLVVGRIQEGIVSMLRYPAEIARSPDTDDEAHVSCSVDHPVRSLRANAAALSVEAADVGGDESRWRQETFRRHPSCLVTAVLHDRTSCLQLREGTLITLSSPDLPVASLASLAVIWHAAGLPWASFSPTVSVRFGGQVREVSVELVHAGADGGG
jgi:hypothetical protein